MEGSSGIVAAIAGKSSRSSPPAFTTSSGVRVELRTPFTTRWMDSFAMECCPAMMSSTNRTPSTAFRTPVRVGSVTRTRVLTATRAAAASSWDEMSKTTTA